MSVDPNPQHHGHHRHHHHHHPWRSAVRQHIFGRPNGMRTPHTHATHEHERHARDMFNPLLSDFWTAFLCANIYTHTRARTQARTPQARRAEHFNKSESRAYLLGGGRGRGVVVTFRVKPVLGALHERIMHTLLSLYTSRVPGQRKRERRENGVPCVRALYKREQHKWGWEVDEQRRLCACIQICITNICRQGDAQTHACTMHSARTCYDDVGLSHTRTQRANVCAAWQNTANGVVGADGFHMVERARGGKCLGTLTLTQTAHAFVVRACISSMRSTELRYSLSLGMCVWECVCVSGPSAVWLDTAHHRSLCGDISKAR